jgi:hypothetical protein
MDDMNVRIESLSLDLGEDASSAELSAAVGRGLFGSLVGRYPHEVADGITAAVQRATLGVGDETSRGNS